MLCTNLQGRLVATKWNAVQKDELLAFIGVLLLAGAEKNWDVDVRQLFLDNKLNPTYKANFGVNRFENIRRNLRFDDKRTRVERLSRINWLLSAIFGAYSSKIVRLNFFSVLILQ